MIPFLSLSFKSSLLSPLCRLALKAGRRELLALALAELHLFRPCSRRHLPGRCCCCCSGSARQRCPAGPGSDSDLGLGLCSSHLGSTVHLCRLCSLPCGCCSEKDQSRRKWPCFSTSPLPSPFGQQRHRDHHCHTHCQ